MFVIASSAEGVGTILRSQDRGATWAPERGGDASTLYGVFGGGEGAVYAVGNSGVILRREQGPI